MDHIRVEAIGSERFRITAQPTCIFVMLGMSSGGAGFGIWEVVIPPNSGILIYYVDENPAIIVRRLRGNRR